jgi:tight adherence protein B
MDAIIAIIMENLTTLVTVIVVFTIIAILLSVRSKRVEMQRHIQRIKLRRGNVHAQVASDISLRRKRVELKGIAYWLTKPLPDFKTIENRLERAGKRVTAKQYVLRRAVWAVGIFSVVHFILGKSLMISAGAGFVFGVWLPLKLLKRSIDKQSKAFLKVFPDAIDLIVRGLRSGLPVSESFVVVSQEIPDPVGSTFVSVTNTMKLGVPMERALQETAKKLNLTEFNFFTTSIVIQRETGGNLAEILNNLSEVLRGRFLMRMKIKAMSSEARASAMIIGALPFVVVALISLISPGYMNLLIVDPRGNFWAGVAAGMMVTGGWIMKKMTQFEI